MNSEPNTSEQTQEEIEPTVEEILNADFGDSEFPSIGFEIEYGTVNDQRDPGSRDARNRVVEGSGRIDPELGAHMLETIAGPIVPHDFRDVERLLGVTENRAAELAAENGLRLVRYGTTPFFGTDEVELTETNERYDFLVEDARNSEPAEMPDEFGMLETIDPETWKAPANLNAFQINYQASTHFYPDEEGVPETVLEAGFDMVNRLQMIQPTLAAFAGNSSIWNGKHLGWNEPRPKLWELNYNTEDKSNRVGPIDGYIEDPIDGFERLHSSFLVDEPGEDYESAARQNYENAEGENWKDARAKIDLDEQTVLAESRLIPTQPSVVDDVTVAAYQTGRLLYSMHNNEPLLPFDRVLENRENALRDGEDTELWYWNEEGELERASSEQVIDLEKERAKEGLRKSGIQGEFYIDRLGDQRDVGLDYVRRVSTWDDVERVAPDEEHDDSEIAEIVAENRRFRSYNDVFQAAESYVKGKDNLGRGAKHVLAEVVPLIEGPSWDERKIEAENTLNHIWNSEHVNPQTVTWGGFVGGQKRPQERLEYSTNVLRASGEVTETVEVDGDGKLHIGYSDGEYVLRYEDSHRTEERSFRPSDTEEIDEFLESL